MTTVPVRLQVRKARDGPWSTGRDRYLKVPVASHRQNAEIGHMKSATSARCVHHPGRRFRLAAKVRLIFILEWVILLVFTQFLHRPP